jgi:hypothetical protein
MLLIQNRVWTADRLQLRGWPNEYFYQLCHHNLETAHHLFAECPMSQQIWNAMGGWASWSKFLPSQWKLDETIREWYSSLTPPYRGSKEKGAHSLAILICWAIWWERNAIVFNMAEKTVTHLITELKDETGLWMQARAKNLTTLVSHRFQVIAIVSRCSSLCS